jgi:hypothetical protein
MDADDPDLAAFRAVLDAYGAEPARWPAERRAAALALLRRSPEARAALAAARDLDRVLDIAAPAPVPADLLGRVLAAAPRARAGRRGWGWLWQPAAAMVAAGFLGIAMGQYLLPFSPIGSPAAAQSLYESEAFSMAGLEGEE